MHPTALEMKMSLGLYVGRPFTLHYGKEYRPFTQAWAFTFSYFTKWPLVNLSYQTWMYSQSANRRRTSANSNSPLSWKVGVRYLQSKKWGTGNLVHRKLLRCELRTTRMPTKFFTCYELLCSKSLGQLCGRCDKLRPLGDNSCLQNLLHGLWSVPRLGVCRCQRDGRLLFVVSAI